MLKVKLNNGKIVLATNNEAHGIVERGEGKLFIEYEHKAMVPQSSKKYFTKGVKRGRKRTRTNNKG